MDSYEVYVKTDSRNNIIEINSDYYLTDFSAFCKIDEGVGLKYREASECYLEKGLMSFGKSCAHYNYKLIDGKAVERTEEEKEREPYSSEEEI